MLSCYNRIIVIGILPGACYAGGMTSLLYSRGIRIFGYARFAEGRVHVIWAMEGCPSSTTWLDKSNSHVFLRPAQGKCLHDCFYFIDTEFGLCCLRVSTWAPLRRNSSSMARQPWLASPARVQSARLNNRSISRVTLADPRSRIAALACPEPCCLPDVNTASSTGRKLLTQNACSASLGRPSMCGLEATSAPGASEARWLRAGSP